MQESIGEDAKKALGAEAAEQLMQQMKKFCSGITIHITEQGMAIEGQEMPGFEVRGCVVKLHVAHGGKLHARGPADPPGFRLVEVEIKMRLEHDGVGYTVETSRRFK